MYKKLGKRLLDIVFSTILIVLLLPFLSLIAVLLKLFDQGPLIFIQERVGVDGVAFKLFKLRSMPLSTGDISSDKVNKISLNPIQKFIRRTNIDEIPQLFNILKGQMSFIGPRPALINQTELNELRKKLGIDRFKPGLSGLAQIKSFTGMSVSEKVEMDEMYCSDIKFSKDLYIFFMTFIYILKPPPVY